MGGGFALARSVQEISLKDVIEIIEGKLCLVTCLGAPDQCIRSDECLIAPFWQEVQSFIDEVIGSIVIEDLVHPEKRKAMLLQLQTCRNLYREKAQSMKEMRDTSTSSRNS
jgi:DNA-binding IscR family transcriptional regulator